jgi:hypothetical protein
MSFNSPPLAVQLTRRPDAPHCLPTDGFENYRSELPLHICSVCNLLVRSPVVQPASCFKGSVLVSCFNG